MQAGPRRTCFVRAEMPARSAIDSIRGLPKRLSPTQTDWNNPDWSAISARSSISAAVVTPKSTPRFGSVKPSFIVVDPFPMRRCEPFRQRALSVGDAARLDADTRRVRLRLGQCRAARSDQHDLV